MATYNTVKENQKPTIIPASGMKFRGINATGGSTNFDYDDVIQFVRRVETVADLNSQIVKTDDKENIVYVKGYTETGDGGEGVFQYNASLSGQNNGGTIINGWVRQYSGAVNVKWFGASGLGQVDDFIAINKAIDILDSVEGGEMYFPTGDYLFDSSRLTINGKNIIFTGDGEKSNFILNKDATASSLFYLTTDSENIYFFNLSFTSDSTTYSYPLPADEKYGIIINQGINVTISNCTFKNISQPIKASTNVDSNILTVDNCRFFDCYESVYSNVKNTSISNCYGQNCGSEDDGGHGHFIYFGAADPGIKGMIMQDCIFENGFAAGIRCGWVDAIITNNKITATREGIISTNGSSLIISNNELIDTTSTSISVTDSNALITGNAITNCKDVSILISICEDNVIVSDNKIIGDGSVLGTTVGNKVIYVANSKYVSLLGNKLFNTWHPDRTLQQAIGFVGGSHNVIKDNFLWNAAEDKGIVLDNCTDSIIDGNTILDDGSMDLKPIQSLTNDGVAITNNYIQIGSNRTTSHSFTDELKEIYNGTRSTVIYGVQANLSGLPTTDPAISGQLWNNSGVLNISAG